MARFLLVLLASLAVAAPAQAATFVVTKTTDTKDGACNGDCSLREAIDAANGTTFADEIVLPAGVLVLTLFPKNEDANVAGDLDVLEDLTIRGVNPAATTVQSTLEDRVFDLRGAATDLRLSDLTVSGGRVSAPEDQGGGIRSEEAGELALERVVVRDNVTRGEAANGFGGGIYKAGGSLVLRDSALVGNVATGVGFGGGAFLNAGATASLTNVTVTGNVATLGAGGGIFFNQGLPASFVNTTISGNHSGGQGGGLGGPTTNLRLRSSIVAANTGSFAPDCGGLAISEGGNVLASECAPPLPSDAFTAQPLLGPLTASAVPVLEPLPGSPAIDRAVGPCPATDARGAPRPQGGACDAGAAEAPAAAPPGPPARAGLKALPKKLKLEKGKVAVALRCNPGPTCTGKLTLTVPATGKGKGKKRAPVVLAQKRFSIAGGKQAIVKAPLSKRGKAATAGRQSLGATLSVKLAGLAKPLTAKVQISR